MNETKLLATIRQIPLNEWNPVGVGSNPEAADEYDSYVPQVHALLTAGYCSPEVAAYLADVEEHGMGLQARRAVCRAVAERIFGEWTNFKQKAE